MAKYDEQQDRKGKRFDMDIASPNEPNLAKKEVEEEEPKEVIPDPTYMEIALRQAMEQAERRKPNPRAKKNRGYDADADDMYDRTMRNKINDKD